MANLLSTLLSSTGALRTFDRVLEVTQNNVANASTPGYARQSLQLLSQPFDPDRGTTGGVKPGEVKSARNEYAEQAVRRQTSRLGDAQQRVGGLKTLEAMFDVTGQSGLPAAMNRLFSSFSAWSESPNSTVARQGVLDGAADVARAFQQSSSDLNQAAGDTQQQLRETVTRINDLTAKLKSYNQQIRQGFSRDAGLDAQVHTTLEELSQQVDFTAFKESDGTVTVLMGGTIPLLAGDKQYELSATLGQPTEPPPTYPDGPPTARILSADGADITGKVTTGQLGALLDLHNRVLAGLRGDAYQPGEINRLAKATAERVNQILQEGVIDGTPPQQGAALFTYDGGNDTAIAGTLAVASGLETSDLSAADPGPPSQSNGIAMRLSRLATPEDSADKIDGFSYNEFYGVVAGRVGTELRNAQADQQVQESLVAQAKDLREQSSAVSLDEEATILIQFQRAYQANARLLTVLDQLTQETINLLK